ncbi:MAG TPA: sensor histidine kinase [Trebonia sp.]|jgi:signal transduction histidine kinase|nr:sensor histidine kinase [Trebonia sp.]
MATLVDTEQSPPAPGRQRRPRPWSPRSWRQALYLAAAIPALLGGLIVPYALLRGFKEWDLGRWPALPVALIAAFYALLLLLPVLTDVHRHRLRVTAGIVIAPQPRGQNRWPTRRAIAAAARSQDAWRQVFYHLVAAPALAAAAMAAIGTWLASILLLFVYVYGWGLPAGSMLHRGLYFANPGYYHLPRILGLPVDVWLTVAGVVGLRAAPWLTAGVQALDVRTARALLGPSRTAELEHRVEQLAQTRAGVVDAADAERRRLERDLHDGTQQRLVSLALNLGMARAQVNTTEQARQAIADAHEEAKSALAELRDLIRGLHPAVLEDRGLDAALSGVAARMPIPVRLTVDLPRRPAPVIEAVAYFVVSEGLANIVKHAQASQAEVIVSRAGDRLHIIVSDDGNGGADPRRGTGLTGLAKRAASVDGTFEIVSPPGGPTLLTVDLPCAR